MENSIVKTAKSREIRSAKSRKAQKMISDEDIRRRAYEIYLENGDSFPDELDDWFKAEKELRGYNQ
jgi:tripartite-type tricarboxylate transporter receptor subunit TctC